MSDQPAPVRTKKLPYDDKMRLADYRAVFGGEQGKRVLYDLIARHYVLGTIFEQGSTFSAEPTILARREGQREVVLHILRYMQLRPSDIEETRLGILAQYELEETAGGS